MANRSARIDRSKKSIGLAVAAVTFIGVAAEAATVTWDGGSDGSGSNWNTAGNWIGDVLPAAADSVNFATTGLTANKVISLNAPQTVFTFITQSYNGTQYTLGSAQDKTDGNTLTLSHLNRGSDVYGSTQTIATNIVLATDSNFFVNGSNGAGAQRVTGSIGGVGRSLAKHGTGTLELTAANTYSGGTTINDGTVTLNFNAAGSATANILNATTTLTTRTGALTLNGRNAASTVNSQSFSGTTFDTGAATFSIVNGIASGSTLLDFGALSRTAGSTANFNQPTVATTVGAANGYKTSTANDATGILGAYATVGGANWASNNGTNIVAYSGYATLSGATPGIADDAVSNVRVNNGSSGEIGQSGSVTINTLLVNDTAARTIAVGTGNTLRFGSVGGILTPSGTGILTIGAAGSAGTLTAGGSTTGNAGELIINNATAVNVNSILADNGGGAVRLTKSGAGNLTLASAATHTGGTVVNAGTLTLPAGGNPLATTGDITVTGGTLNLGTSTQSVSGNVSVRGGTLTGGTITKSGSDYDGRAGTISAVLAGSGVRLVKTTPGTLILSADNTYTGDTVVQEGTLSASAAGSIDGNLIVGSPGGGQLAIFSGGANAIADSKSVTVYSNGAASLGGSDNVTNVVLVGGSFNANNGYINGSVTMTGGLLSGSFYGTHSNVFTNASSATAVIAGGNNFGGGQTFTVADGEAPVDLKVTGNLASNGTGTVTKTGSGVMVLAAGSVNAQTNFAITGGTLLANNTSGSATGKAAVAVGAGTTVGGTGIIGGVSGYTAANITLTGVIGNLATLAPGTVNETNGSDILGTLTVGSTAQSNNVTFGNNSRLATTIDASGASDLLAVYGNLNLASVLNSDSLAITGSLGELSGFYSLATFTGTLTGRFDLVTFNGAALLPDGYEIAYRNAAGDAVAGTDPITGGGSIVLVPEPSAIGVVLLGAAGLIRRRRTASPTTPINV